ncbi:nitroreductase family protein [Frisingicoccus sp.]|uniref:nitroreductase family protein n=1 Tax=Frisingicoccus sp. TaxID=1918627 RepID=UPI003869876C
MFCRIRYFNLIINCFVVGLSKKTRRSIRSYKAAMVPQDVIERIVEAGANAASGMNRQTSIILTVTDREIRDKLSKMNAELETFIIR